MSSQTSQHYVTANDLLTGEVVFLAADGRWVVDLARAGFVCDPVEAGVRLASAEADGGRVVGAYLAAATTRNAPVPAHFRERFRATGPSNYAHGKQERDADV